MYLIGYILKPQGLKGEVKVESVTPYLERFNRLDRVFLQLKEKKQAYSIENARVSDRFVYLKFSEINSRDDAELLRTAEVLIEEKDLIQPAQDEYFIHDLIGCQVISENNDVIGVLSDVVQMSSNDVYVVKNGEGIEILIPATKEIVKRVNVEQKQIIIHMLEGLLE
ncbi:MAG: 16S rRNA processing protein RimM [Calditrichia bacterium]|nr:16S rRNA processing protein RimM [Calditrichia bacterium]